MNGSRPSRTVLVEPKAQRWRALVKFKDHREALLYVGSSHLQVREGYREPWADHFDAEERANTHEIHLQRWIGLPDRGSWVTQGPMPIPVVL